MILVFDIEPGSGGPAPSVDLKANGNDGPIDVADGARPTLSWNSSNADWCVASGNWSGSKTVQGSGTQVGPLSGPNTYQYTIRCGRGTGSTEVSSQDSVIVNVAAASLRCAPLTQDRAVNEKASLGASGGTGQYTWSAPGGNPASGNQATFKPAYATAGLKKVELTNGGVTKVCEVNVLPPPVIDPTCSGPATVALNTPATFEAREGNGSYLWSTNPDGNPEGANGNRFTTRWNSAGQKTVEVQSGGRSGTCTVTVTGGTSLSCSGPATATVDADVTFRALNGPNGGYSWTGGGTPPSGNTVAFVTRFTSAGPKTVSVTRGSQTATCNIVITPPAAPQGCTIQVNAVTTPTNWTIGGLIPNNQPLRSPNYPQLVFSATYTTDSSGNQLPGGRTYSITPAPQAGSWSGPSVSLNSSLFCPPGGRITFNISYTSNQTGNLACTPEQQFVSMGQAADFSASGGSGNYSWNAPGGVPSNGTGANFSSVFAGGNRTVTLSDGNSTDTCEVNVMGPTPVVCTGPAELGVNQEGTWFGSLGTGTYTWNASAQGSGQAIPVAGSGQTFRTRFTATGQKVVTVWSGSANRQCTVNVNNSTHSECNNKSCVQVSGSGPNRCGSSADCGGGPGGQFHGVCDAVQRACVNVAGGGPSTCGSDPSCTGITESHLECQNNSCVIIGGPGANTCNAIGGSCTPEPPTGGPCTFNGSPLLIRKGDASQLSWSCPGALSCTVTDTLGGTSLNGSSAASGGAIGNVSARPAKTTPYALSCTGAGPGPWSGALTVRVLSIIEVRPGQNQN